MWGGVAKASYDPANTPDYASSILGPMRSYYTSKEREDKELLSANVEVSDSSLKIKYLSYLPQITEKICWIQRF